MDRVDAVVIGAGAVGLAVGRALAQAGRETIVAEPYMTTKDVYLGDWLGLYTEVVIDRASGHVEYTLVEID